ncbi:MAG: hypothetical protein ACJAS8_001535 [Cycloclasticus pugetii]|jgi:hypothetical protein
MLIKFSIDNKKTNIQVINGHIIYIANYIVIN